MSADVGARILSLAEDAGGEAGEFLDELARASYHAPAEVADFLAKVLDRKREGLDRSSRYARKRGEEVNLID